MILLLAVSVAVYIFGLSALIYLAGNSDSRKPSDAIIVLGAAQYDGRPSPVFQGRLDHAASLYREGLAEYILVTGGKQPGDRFTEAEAGRRYLIRQEIPDNAILMEPTATTTRENLKASSELLQEHKLHTAIVVSDPFHAFRVRKLAQDLKMPVVFSPAEESRVKSPSMKFRFIMREIWVYHVYLVRGS